MKKTLFVIFLTFITISCSGCKVFVSGDQYQLLQRDFETQISLNQTMKEEMRTLREELIEVRRELDAAKAELDLLRRITPPIPPDALQDLEPDKDAAQDDSPPAAREEGAVSAVEKTSGAQDAPPQSAASSASDAGAQTEGTSSISSVPPSAGSSSAPSALPDDKQQRKFQDIADTLGK